MKLRNVASIIIKLLSLLLKISVTYRTVNYHYLLKFPQLIEWSNWDNETKCTTKKGNTCGNGTILRTRNCTANDTDYPNNEEECLKRYPAEKARIKIDCFADCYGNVL